MGILRQSIAEDLATILAYSDVGVNVSVISPAPVDLSNLSPNSVVYFPLLVPPPLCNATTLNLVANDSLWVDTTTFLNSYYATVPLSFPSENFPWSNATAMESLREIIQYMVRNLTKNTSTVVLQSFNNSPTNITFTAYIPNPVQKTTILRVQNISLFESGPLQSFLSESFPVVGMVNISSGITPWSNGTTMGILTAKWISSIAGLLGTTNVNVRLANIGSSVTTFLVFAPSAYQNRTTQSLLQASPFYSVQQFLYDYFPKNVNATFELNSIPWSNATAMRIVTSLIVNQTVSLYDFANVGVNGTTMDLSSSPPTISFKIIIPPAFDNSTSAERLKGSPYSSFPALTSYLAQYYPQNIFALFPLGRLPTTNATAMEIIRQLVELDAQDILKFPNIGADSFVTYTNATSGVESTAFPLLVPPSFANSTTWNLLSSSTFKRVEAFLNTYFPTPAPTPAPTPSPIYVFIKTYPAAVLPVGNSTQMNMIREAIAEDATNSLQFPVNVTNVTFDAILQEFIYSISMPGSFNNATTGILLTESSWPITSSFIALFGVGNDIGCTACGAVAQASASEGCSKGCVIGVAIVIAVIVGILVIVCIVCISKRKSVTRVVSPYSSVLADGGKAAKGEELA
jgi:hypothetical protein